MSSSFGISGQPFEDCGAFAGYSFSNFDSVKDSAGDSSPIIGGAPYNAGEDVFSSQAALEIPYPSPIYSAAAFSPEQNGKGVDGGFGASDGPILPPSTDMVAEEGFALREWRMQNAIQLEEKEKKEKEMRSQIIEEAEEYKIEFYRKREVNVEKNKLLTGKERSYFWQAVRSSMLKLKKTTGRQLVNSFRTKCLQWRREGKRTKRRSLLLL